MREDRYRRETPATSCQQCGLRMRMWHKEYENKRHSFDRTSGKMFVFEKERGQW
jgi:hypothetical protein